MKVKLIQAPQDPVDIMWVAARTCYSEKSPIELWENDRFPKNEGLGEWEYEVNKERRHWELVKRVLSSGHTSIAENISLTFVIEGISRACLAQLTRHRAGVVFAVQSQRYVEFKDGNFDFVYPLAVERNPEFVKVFDEAVEKISQTYAKLTGEKVKPEDARAILPNAAKTNLVMTINLRELMHVCNLRLCVRAQHEIRNLFTEIKKETEKYNPLIASLLVPSCEAMGGICFEHKGCHRYPSVEDVLAAYEKE